MTTEEMRKCVEFRKGNMDAVRAKIDYIYQRTFDMFDALDANKDKDACFEYWITLFNEDMSSYSKEEREYFTAVCSGLVHLIDDFMKFKEVEK